MFVVAMFQVILFDEEAQSLNGETAVAQCVVAARRATYTEMVGGGLERGADGGASRF